MVKKYTAKSDISISIRVKGHARHVSFCPLTLGGSVYYTADEDEQQALEAHYRYGQLFSGEEVVEVTRAEKKAAKKEGNKIAEISVSCIDDAKDYLSDKFNESRTHMRSKKAILELATKHNVRFVGGDFEEKKEENKEGE